MADREKVNILMVDDQPAKLLSYKAILKDLDENLIEATTYKEVLEYLLKKDIAVVLMDVSMPEMDGFEMAEVIRQHPRFQKTAIIFVSAVHFTELDRLKGYQRGAVDYVSVPVVPELLRAKVSVFADLHRKSRELELLNGELRRLSASLITTQDDERRRIARALHDGLGQDLTAAKIMLQGIARNSVPSDPQQEKLMEDVTRLIGGAIQQVREMSYLLHPPLLDEVGLSSALGWYLDGLSKVGGIPTTMSFQPLDFPRLPPEVEMTLFRIIQESLTNVFRHSKATRAKVRVTLDENKVTASVQDDGVGLLLDVVEFRPEKLGIGISGMKQRVKDLGGAIRLRNASPGTIVEVTVPLACAEAAVTGALRPLRMPESLPK